MCSCSTDQGDYYWKVTPPAAEEMDWGQDTERSAAGLACQVYLDDWDKELQIGTAEGHRIGHPKSNQTQLSACLLQLLVFNDLKKKIWANLAWHCDNAWMCHWSYSK